MVSLSVVACIFYVLETYTGKSYGVIYVAGLQEQIVTQFFAVDFVLNLFCAASVLRYFANPWTIVDLVTILPSYVQYIFSGKRVNLSVLRFVRILRLVRILRTFKLLGSLSGIRRQIITLSLTMVSLVFMAAGVIQIMENDVKQLLYYKCNFSTEATGWSPSCTKSHPASPDCDCSTNSCYSYYSTGDPKGEPSGVRCAGLTYLDAFYYMVVTGV